MCNVNSYQQCGPGGCGDCAEGLESSPSPSCSAENKIKYLVKPVISNIFVLYLYMQLQYIWAGTKKKKSRHAWGHITSALKDCKLYCRWTQKVKSHPRFSIKVSFGLQGEHSRTFRVQKCCAISKIATKTDSWEVHTDLIQQDSGGACISHIISDKIYFISIY